MRGDPFVAHSKDQIRSRPRRERPKRSKTYTYTILVHPADSDESGYWVEVPALPGCFTQGETVDECLVHAQEAIRCFVQGLIEDGKPIPEEPRRDGAVVSEVNWELARRSSASCCDPATRFPKC